MTLHYILIALFLLAGGAVLSLTVFFKVAEISVVGTDKYSSQEIIAASGLKLEENLFRVDTKAVREILMERFPYIEQVYVRRRLPPKVEIEIVQSTPVGAVADGENYVLISKNGKLLERGILFIPVDIPLITGVDVGQVAVGQPLGEEAAEQMKMLEYLFAAMEESGFKNITNVDLSDRLNMRVVYQDRILLELGSEADLAYKLTFVEAVLRDKLGPDEQGVLDVTAASKKKAVFRAGNIHQTGEITGGSQGLEEPVEIQLDGQSEGESQPSAAS
ncbi:FtsQ-type POTRA domain-containing protein [Oscillospiraceae bacterium MB08-C2-2]|nr:FtsQ-type POTRA domain-containing protein [Oscillospiraceae bacterium MB08-C2-2]